MGRLACRRMERLISREMDAPGATTISLDEAEHRQLSGHLDECDECRRFRETLRHQRDAFRSISAAPPIPGVLAARAMQTWAAEHFVAPQDRSRRAGGALIATALGAIAIALVTVSWLREGKPNGTPVVQAGSARERSTGRPRQTIQHFSTPVGHLANGDRNRGTNDHPLGRPISAASPVMPDGPSLVHNEQSVPGMAVRSASLLKVTKGETVEDDLKYVNGDADAFSSRWARLAPQDVERFEAELRTAVRGGDDFVETPFPMIASTDRRAAFAAIAAYRQERQIVDPRLQRKISLGVKRTAFSDLCDRLTRETSIDFSAARAVADDKVTLFCKDRPLRDIMRAVADLFNFTWERTGEEGSYQYRLKQSLKAQLLEEELRNRDRNEALVALDQDMDRYRKFLKLTPEQARAMADGATGDEKKKLEALGSTGWGPAQIYFSLSQDQMEALRDGQALKFSAADGSGNTPLPPNIAQGVLHSLDEMARVNRMPNGGYELWMGRDAIKGRPGLPPSAAPGAKANARLALQASELGKFTLEGGSGFEIQDTPNDKSAAWTGDTLAEGKSPSSRDPKNAEANADQAKASDLAKKVTLGPERADAKDKEAARVTTADILEAIHRATGRDVIGDYYTRLFDAEAVSASEVSLFDALCHVCDAARLRWGRQDSWLTFRSASFFNDRPKEVPNRLLERWAASRKANKDVLPLDSLAEIAQLTDVQLDGEAMAEGARTLYGLGEWDDVRASNLRATWRLVAALPPAVRRAAQSEKGVVFEQFTLPQQQQFARATLGDDESGGSLEDLAGASLHVYYGPAKDAPRGASARVATNDKPTVRFTYVYGSPGGGHVRKTIGPGSTSMENDGPRPNPMPVPTGGVSGAAPGE